MSIAHIEAIRAALERTHWIIVGERLVDEYDATAYWEIARPDGTSLLTIQFDGGWDADGLTKYTFEECPGCEIVGHSEVSCYFARINRSWPSELNQFIKQLNQLR